MADRVRVAIVGTGFGARVQAPGFRVHPEFELAAIVSASPERAAAAAQELGGLRAYTDYARMLSEVKPDLVSIVTPPGLHAPQTLAALDAGAHVLCEKPFALTAAEARQMLARATALKRVHVIDHEFRFLPARHYQKTLVDRGYVGAVRALEVTHFATGRADPQRAWNWWSDAAQGGGMLGAIGSHYIDTFRWLAGSEVAAVSAQLTTFIAERPFAGGRRAVTADDSCSLLLRMQNGVQGVINLSIVAAAPVMRLTVHGSGGALLVEDDLRLSGSHTDEPLRPIEIPAEFVPAGWRDDRILVGPFALLAGRMLAAIRGGAPAAPDFADGLRVQSVLDAARESARTGRTVEISD
jgi:predicted dehydrogenase